MSGHLLVLEHPRRSRVCAQRTDASVVTGTVSHGSAMLVPSLDRTGETVTLAGADNVDLVARREHVAGDRAANFIRRAVIQPELFESAHRLDARLRVVALQGLVGQLVRSLVVLVRAERHLYGVVAVLVHGLLLNDGAGTCLHDRDRDHYAVFGEDLAHPEFLSNDCFIHR